MKLYSIRAEGVFLALTLGLILLSTNHLLAQGVPALSKEKVQAIISDLQAGHHQIDLPIPGGQNESFSFQAEQIMEAGLANQYPEIRAWRAISPSGWEMYLDHDATQLHLTALKAGQTWFLVPSPSGNAFRYQKAGTDTAKQSLNCFADEREYGLAAFPQSNHGSGSGRLQQAHHHVFRVAIAATGEYTIYHGGSKSLAVAKIVSVVNRLNAIFRRDVAISFQLVAGNDQLVFTQPYTDPFTSGNLYSLIQENQLLLDQVIGDANYDIGIVFDQAPAGAIAYYNSACQSGYKGQAAVSLTHPDGDAFAVDYVAHEFGHFFGAHHTHNNPCFRYAPTAYEPGSGSTIMGYAGVCSPSYQQNSDAYFHGASIDEIRQAVSSGLLCGQPSTASNQAPFVLVSQPQFAIPKGTPFTLSATATDPDGDSLSFAWEQWDLGHPGPSDPYQAYGPLIRSRAPSSSPDRIIPRLEDLLNGSISSEEALPEVDRDLRFRLTSRDHHPQASLIGSGYIDLEVSAQAGPFRVLEPTLGTDWPVGSMQWVKWDVANTDQAPVYCDKVDIWLSTDGGYHFDSLLAAAVPNIGHAAVLVPDLAGQEARIRVSATNNIFFALSEADFSISAVSTPVYYLFNLNPAPEVCLGDSLLFRMWLGGLGGYQGVFSLKAAYAQDPNILAQWENNNPIAIDNFIQLRLPTVPNLTGWQSLEITVVDQAGDSLQESYDFYVVADFPEQAALMHPEDGSILSQLDRLNWGYCADASAYRWELALTPDFDASVIASGITLDTTSLPLAPLQAGQVYYWRVQSRNSCGDGPYSRVASFATPGEACQQYWSTDIPKAIPVQVAPYTITSKLIIPDDYTISKIRLLDLQIQHSWINDLQATLRKENYPEQVDLFDQVCGPNIANLDLGFADDASTPNIPCPPTTGQLYQPLDSLRHFSGSGSQGKWFLDITDLIDLDGGTLTKWGLEVCYQTDQAQPPELLRNEGLQISQWGQAVIDPNLLSSTANCAPEQLIYTLVEMPKYGSLKLNGLILSPGDTFSQSAIDSLQLQYQHQGQAVSDDGFSFTLRSHDGGWMGTPYFPIAVSLTTPSENDLLPTAFQLYPNPAQDGFWIAFDESSKAPIEFSLYDLQGRRLRNQSFPAGASKVEIQRASLSSGIYFVKVRYKGQISVLRVVLE